MSEANQGALAGTKVLDLTRILAGPLCAQMLGDMGAEVIKVEPPGAGDDTRSWGPPFAGNESAYFLGINRNKRSITLNMAVKAGQEILARLIQQCDVLVENFKAGTLEKWGFTNDWLQQHAPRVVRCSITGYGTDGPKGGLPGYDFILQAESGLMSICGETDGDPMKYGVAIVDITTGLLACNTILAALNARHQTGRGQHVEVSLYESGLFMLANVASNHLVSGRDARRFGNGHPNIVPYTAYPVKDGMIAVAVGNRCTLSEKPGSRGQSRGDRCTDHRGIEGLRRRIADCHADEGRYSLRAHQQCGAGVECAAHRRARHGAKRAASDRGRGQGAGHAVSLQRHAAVDPPCAAHVGAAYRAGVGRRTRPVTGAHCRVAGAENRLMRMAAD
jgi:hypothetical protein